MRDKILAGLVGVPLTLGMIVLFTVMSLPYVIWWLFDDFRTSRDSR